jgi:hypothetical protein
MPERIPPYLIALAVGELAFRPLGTRTGVYAEPSVVDAAAWEFADTEKMVEAAEALYGPYRWGRYDILLLPPSFPFGGMENPRLTFASPTVLAGDRSLVSLIAHELAHSWSGNLVTNATWADFWLNEGMTVYFEGRIIEALYGRERTAMDEVWGMLDLEQEMDELGRDTKKTALHRDLRGEDPDDGVNGVPYVKGATFLRMLEKAVGREALDAFLKRYFDDNAFTSMTTARFLARVKSDLLHGDAQQAAALKLDEWVYEPAWPSNKPTPTSTMLEKVDVAVHAFAAGAAPSALDAKGWVTQQTVWFLKNLPREQPPGRLKALDDALALSSSKNSEILFEWLTLAIANQYEPAVPVLEAFVTRQGRRRLVLPLYEDLVKTTWGKPIAVRIYAHARPGYHPLTAASVDEVLASH